ncbi:MAG: hypothetical protein ACR2NV_07760 [Thermoleophilaceae bacterium]
MAVGTINVRDVLGRRVMACAAVAAVACALSLVPVAQAGAKPLTGPSTVAPGASVRFVASGLQPGVRVAVTLTRVGGGAPRAVPVEARTDARGTAVIRFRFPRASNVCRAGSRCAPRAWRRGQRVELDVVTASADGSASAVGTVLTVR